MAQGDFPRPIFIIGCHRSGTTLMRLIIDSHPRLSCGPETRFLADLEAVTGANWQRMQQYGFPKEYWHERFATFFRGIHADYATRRGKLRWADKTPSYALQMDFIGELFPDCQFIHVVRDGRDVVASHQDRFGYVAAVKAVEKWPDYIRRARAAGATLPSDRYIEVRYEDLVGALEPTLRKLLEYLGEPWDDAVLAPEKAPHDVPEKYRSLQATRTREGESAVYRSRVGAHRRELDPLLRTLFRLRAAAMLRELGYA